MRFLRPAGAILLLGLILLATGQAPQSALAADAIVAGSICTPADLATAITTASNGGTVSFDCDNPAIQFSAGDAITISTTVTIDGSNSGNQIVLDGQAQTNFFVVVSGGNLTVEHMSFQNGGGAIQGGAINVVFNSGGVLTVTACTFSDNSAEFGGAIYHRGSSLTVSQSSFTGNRSSAGGAINNLASTANISQSSFIDNTGTDHGGAVDLGSFHGTATITSSTFSGNTGRHGSAIFGHYAIGQTHIAWSTIIQRELTGKALQTYENLTLTGVILGGEVGFFGLIGHCQFYLNGDFTDSYSLTNTNNTYNANTCSFDGEGSREDIAYSDGLTNVGLDSLTTATVNGVVQSYYPVLEGGPAHDQVPDSVCDLDLQPGPELDQLGNPRRVGSTCNIGAIEDENIPGSISSIEISEDQIDEGGSVTVTASAIDSDGGPNPLTYTIDCDINDAVDPVAGSSTSCTYPQNGIITGQVSVFDGRATSWQHFTVIVNNLPPTASLDVSSTSINEGGSVTVSLSASDVPADLPLTYTIDCDTSDEIDPTSASSATCTYPDDGSFTGQATASDDTVTVTKPFTITVNNVAPSMTTVIPTTTVAGLDQPVSVQLAATDVPADTLSFTVDCDNGTTATVPATSSTPGVFTATGTCSFDTAGDYTVSAYATDDDAGVSDTLAATTEIQIFDFSVDPSVVNLNEGESVTVVASIVNPPSTPLGYTIDCNINDPAPPVPSSSTTCSYPDNGTFTGQATVSVASSIPTTSFTVNVANLAPTMQSLTPDITLAEVNQSIGIRMTASDVPADGLSFTIDCDNGDIATIPATVSSPGIFAAEGSCSYASSGFYVISVYASDDDGGESAILIATPVHVVAPAILCANQWTGQLRIVDNTDCGRSETQFVLPTDRPLSLCVNDWNGSTSLGPRCARSEHQLIAIGDESIEICVNRWNGSFRVGDRCNRSERADLL